MPVMRALKSFRVSETGEIVQPGHQFSCSDNAAGYYQKRGMALLAVYSAKPIENKAAQDGPFVSPGGKTGAAEPPRLSGPAPRRRGRPSNASKAEPKS